MLTSESKTRVPHILRAPSKLNPLLTHWRGDYALLPTLFVTMLGLRVLLGIIQPSIPEPQIHLWVIFSVVVFLWQVVGTSRASELFLKDTGNVPGVVVGYLSILTVAMFTVVQVADALASTNKPVVAQAEPGTLPLSIDEKTIRVNGSLEYHHGASAEHTCRNAMLFCLYSCIPCRQTKNHGRDGKAWFSQVQA